MAEGRLDRNQRPLAVVDRRAQPPPMAGISPGMILVALQLITCKQHSSLLSEEMVLRSFAPLSWLRADADQTKSTFREGNRHDLSPPSVPRHGSDAGLALECCDRQWRFCPGPGNRSSDNRARSSRPGCCRAGSCPGDKRSACDCVADDFPADCRGAIGGAKRNRCAGWRTCSPCTIGRRTGRTCAPADGTGNLRRCSIFRSAGPCA